MSDTHAPHLIPVDVPWRLFLERLALALAEGRPPPRHHHPLLSIPRNLAIGVVFLGLSLRSAIAR